MLTTNYYNMKYNNRLHTSAQTTGRDYPTIEREFSDLKQFRSADGTFLTGGTMSYGGGDILFGVIPKNPIYNVSPTSVKGNFAIGFDGSNTPASIDDYKLIEPILNCGIIAVTYNKIDNTIIRDFTIKNNNGNEIIINGVGLFGLFSLDYTDGGYYFNLPLLYREVFASPITVPANSSFIYRLEITVGE